MTLAQEAQRSGIACVSAVFSGVLQQQALPVEEHRPQHGDTGAVFVLMPACSRIQARSSTEL